MAVLSTMEPQNVLAISYSTSLLRMTMTLLTTAGHQRNGGAELPPPCQYALSKPGHLPSSICHTMLSSTRTSQARKRLRRVTSGGLSVLLASDRHPSGLEYKVSWEKTLWLLKTTMDTKLVRRYRAEQRAATRVRTRWSSRLEERAARWDCSAGSRQ